MNSKKFREWISRYSYGICIAVIVWVALVFVPTLNTDGTVKLNIPSSTFELIAYLLIRGLVAVMVFTIFVLFDMQGKNNILDDPAYLEAYNLLNTVEDKEYKPISPKAYKLKTYGFKAISLSITTALSAMVIMEMVLTYNWSYLLAYGLSMITALISGVMQMKKAEIYWTEEYPKWAHYIIKHLNDKDKQELNNDSREVKNA